MNKKIKIEMSYEKEKFLIVLNKALFFVIGENQLLENCFGKRALFSRRINPSDGFIHFKKASGITWIIPKDTIIKRLTQAIKKACDNKSLSNDDFELELVIPSILEENESKLLNGDEKECELYSLDDLFKDLNEIENILKQSKGDL